MVTSITGEMRRHLMYVFGMLKSTHSGFHKTNSALINANCGVKDAVFNVFIEGMAECLRCEEIVQYMFYNGKYMG